MARQAVKITVEVCPGRDEDGDNRVVARVPPKLKGSAGLTLVKKEAEVEADDDRLALEFLAHWDVY